MSDQATDAREACIEAMARAMDDWDRDPAEQCLLDCERALDALLAPSRVPCPTCSPDREKAANMGRALDVDEATADAVSEVLVATFDALRCTNPDCSDGTVEGPSLAEQVLGRDTAARLIVEYHEAVEATGDEWDRADSLRRDAIEDRMRNASYALHEFARRRSSESAPTGGTT